MICFCTCCASAVRCSRVRTSVRRLREKIEADPGKPQYILTKRGAGYYFAP